MRIKEGFILRKIADSDVVIPMGDNIAEFNGVVSLNETAVFLWSCLKEEIEMSQMVDALTAHYSVTREIAQKDTENFILQLKQRNMLDNYA